MPINFEVYARPNVTLQSIASWERLLNVLEIGIKADSDIYYPMQEIFDVPQPIPSWAEYVGSSSADVKYAMQEILDTSQPNSWENYLQSSSANVRYPSQTIEEV